MDLFFRKYFLPATGLLILLIWGAAVFMNSRTVKNRIKAHQNSTGVYISAITTDSVSRKVFFHYLFEHNGLVKTGKVLTSLDSEKLSFLNTALLRKPLRLVYDSTNLSNNQLLLTYEDFADFHVGGRDTMRVYKALDSINRMDSWDSPDAPAGSISGEYLYFETHSADLDTLKQVVLVRYVRNTGFSQVVRMDTFTIKPDYYHNKGEKPCWNFDLAPSGIDSTTDVFKFDYELDFIHFPHPRVRYSHFVLETKGVYHRYVHNIDSVTYNGTPMKNGISANALEIL